MKFVIGLLSGPGSLCAHVCELKELGSASDFLGGQFLDHLLVFDPSLECYVHGFTCNPWNGILSLREASNEVSQ